MNPNEKFTNEMVAYTKKCLKDLAKISEKYDADPSGVTRVLGLELVRIADEGRKEYENSIKTMETYKKVNESLQKDK